MILNCTIRPILHERQVHGRANSSQHPTRGRSLARRFRGSHSATLRVALPARKGRARVSSKSVRPSEVHVISISLMDPWNTADCGLAIRGRPPAPEPVGGSSDEHECE